MKQYDRIHLIVAALLLLTPMNPGKADAEDPKTAARAMGDAGRTAAAVVAKDPASASRVPGYAGTDLKERDLGAADLEDAANAVLSDPDDPGGEAGRYVTKGVSARQEIKIKSDDPVAVRGEEVQGEPSAPRFKASGLASGSSTDCAAGLGQAESGGTCGGVSWCVGADCESIASQANAGLIESTAKLNMVLELGGEEFDRGNLLFFTGKGGRAGYAGADWPIVARIRGCSSVSGIVPNPNASSHRSATRAIPITSGSGARSASSASASARNVSGASSARNSAASCRRRRGRNSASAGAAAAASPSRRWNGSTSRRWILLSSRRTSWTAHTNHPLRSLTPGIPAP